MGTIMARKRKDGSTGYTAQIVKKRDGKIILREAKTFSREREARAWAAFREEELDKPGALERVTGEDPILADVIDQYLREARGGFGRTKTQVLNSIKDDFDIATKRSSAIRTDDLVAFARELATTRSGATVLMYLSFLTTVFKVARPAWNYPLDVQTIEDAIVAAKRLKLTSRSAKRDRRPTLAELDKLMTFFTGRKAGSMPMTTLTAFAIFSTRREGEIVRIRWDDLDETHSRIMVRDMKDPKGAAGNHMWIELTPEALRIIKAMPRVDGQERIFPFTGDAIDAAWREACKLLEIADLRFHDLRHEGISRLFEMGRTIPQVASVSGHRSWQNLQRYTHLRQTGDKFENWKWLDVVAPRSA